MMHWDTANKSIFTVTAVCWIAGTSFVVIDASSQTNDVVTVTPHDSATAARITLVPVKVGIHSTYRALTKLIPDREVW